MSVGEIVVVLVMLYVGVLDFVTGLSRARNI